MQFCLLFHSQVQCAKKHSSKSFQEFNAFKIEGKAIFSKIMRSLKLTWKPFLTLYHMGGGSARTPPWRYQRHSVVDAPTNSRFLDFSQLHLNFHLVKSFFAPFFCNFYKKITVNFFFDLKNNDFLMKWSKSFFSRKY